jgi:hypothetical protein
MREWDRERPLSLFLSLSLSLSLVSLSHSGVFIVELGDKS